MGNRTSVTERYTVTYAFDDDSRGRDAEAIDRIREAVEELQREGLKIAFHGATGVVDEAGQLLSVTVRYEASSQGVVGLLNCLATLPACGSPQPTGEERVLVGSSHDRP